MILCWCLLYSFFTFFIVIHFSICDSHVKELKRKSWEFFFFWTIGITPQRKIYSTP
ncbi:hypothetical protein BDA99DRAFT_523181 [Phascolomyces articulosus]|uniref:Uncharacterized protein n=1 Tax=Phascolomyces articulosus TaxID=60185 RepID=A0AAD5P9S0_9FUNG|nr:hypothetical protein BDA99DRAFT_523181 [Phascolomyces articulosus]